VALRYVEQLASEHGARLRSTRPEPEEGDEEEQIEANGFAPAGSTALHWVVARNPMAPNGVAWVRWLLARKPGAAGQRDAEGKTALDQARLRNNPEYIGLLQTAVEAACTFRNRYILTSAGIIDADAGLTPRAVRYEGVDRSTGQRVVTSQSNPPLLVFCRVFFSDGLVVATDDAVLRGGCEQRAGRDGGGGGAAAGGDRALHGPRGRARAA